MWTSDNHFHVHPPSLVANPEEADEVGLFRTAHSQRAVYIAGEFGSDIVTAFTMMARKRYITVTLFDKDGMNVRKHKISHGELEASFGKANECYLGKMIYRVYACCDYLILRWPRRLRSRNNCKEFLMSFVIIKLERTAWIVKKTFKKELFHIKLNYRHRKVPESIFGCEKDGNLYFFTSRPRPKFRVFHGIHQIYVSDFDEQLVHQLHRSSLVESAQLGQNRLLLRYKSFSRIVLLDKVCKPYATSMGNRRNGKELCTGQVIIKKIHGNYRYVFTDNDERIIVWQDITNNRKKMYASIYVPSSMNDL
jgi:hypothetical protein